MSSSHHIPKAFRGLPIPPIIACKEQTGEDLLALSRNQRHYACTSLIPNNGSSATLSNTTHFFLDIIPIDPRQGYVFGCCHLDTDFQLPSNKEKNHMFISRFQFRILVNDNLEWTLIDESSNGTMVNGIRILSSRGQKIYAEQREPVLNYPTQMTLILGRSNSIQVGFGALKFDIYVLGNPVECHHGSTMIPQKISTTPRQLHWLESKSNRHSEGSLPSASGEADERESTNMLIRSQDAGVERFDHAKDNPENSIYDLANPKFFHDYHGAFKDRGDVEMELDTTSGMLPQFEQLQLQSQSQGVESMGKEGFKNSDEMQMMEE